MYNNYSAIFFSGPDEILLRIMFLTVRDYFNCLCNIFQTWPIISPGFPVGVQPYSAYLARTRPEDPSSKIKRPHTESLVVTLFSAFLMRLKSEGVHSTEADASCFSFLSVQKKTEKFVLRLSSEELISLVDLILSESELNSRDSPHDDKSSLDQASCSLIQSRLPLLHSYCNGDLENIKKVSEYLINCTKKWEDR